MWTRNIVQKHCSVSCRTLIFSRVRPMCSPIKLVKISQSMPKPPIEFDVYTLNRITANANGYHFEFRFFFLNHPCTTCVVAFSMFLKYPSNYSLFAINPQNPRFFGKKWMTSPKSFPLQASCQRHPEMLTPCNALITAEKNHGAWICGHAMGSIANLNQPWRYPLVNIQKAIETWP